MEKHDVWQMVIVDWESKQYATIAPPTDEENWRSRVCTEKGKGRDIHCFSHDVADTSGLSRWARQHELTQTDVSNIVSLS